MNCSICLKEISTNRDYLPSIISPWIRELGSIKKRISKLRYCDKCNGAFFSLRYSELQMQDIYAEYRGLKYMSIRSKWEKWYTHDYNDAHESQGFIEQRKKILELFLQKHGLIKVGSVVDVGGDLGQFIPDFQEETKKYVLDFSNRQLVPGVTKILSFDDITNPDVIIYAHVLEHVSEPLKELADLLNHSENVYIEVPYGVPIKSKLRQSRMILLLGYFASLIPFIWTKFARPSAGRSVTAAILRQSEHINFFSPDTFNVMADALGADLNIQISNIPTPDNSTIQVIQVLLKKTNFTS
jgi:hypothetical protein